MNTSKLKQFKIQKYNPVKKLIGQIFYNIRNDNNIYNYHYT